MAAVWERQKMTRLYHALMEIESLVDPKAFQTTAVSHEWHFCPVCGDKLTPGLA